MPSPTEMYIVLDSLVSSGSLTIDSLLDYVIRHEAVHTGPEVDLRTHLHEAIERNLTSMVSEGESQKNVLPLEGGYTIVRPIDLFLGCL